MGRKLAMVTSLHGMILEVGLLNINPGEPSVIPISKRLMAMASMSPNWGSSSKWPFHGLKNRGGAYYFTFHHARCFTPGFSVPSDGPTVCHSKPETFWMLASPWKFPTKNQKGTAERCEGNNILKKNPDFSDMTRLWFFESWGIIIWATAFIYFDEKKMWRQAGFEEMLVSPAKTRSERDGGTPKTR